MASIARGTALSRRGFTCFAHRGPGPPERANAGEHQHPQRHEIYDRDQQEQAHRHAGGTARLSTYGQNTPNVVYYARGHVNEWRPEQADQAIADLSNGDSSILLVTEEGLRTIESNLPSGTGIVGRVRPLFKDGDFLLIGRTDAPAPRQAAATESLTR